MWLALGESALRRQRELEDACHDGERNAEQIAVAGRGVAASYGLGASLEASRLVA